MEGHGMMRERLSAAQAGNEDAVREVALYVYDRYQHRISKLHSVHPVLGIDDMLATFAEAVVRSVVIADGRGDDFYHIGQRGVWAVLSEIRAYHREMKRRIRTGLFVDDEATASWEEQTADRCEPSFVDDVIDNIEREHAAEVFARGQFNGREQQAIEVIVSGRAGDPEDKGFNRRLAEAMGVSPQRVSQVIKKLRASDVMVELAEVLGDR